MYWKNYHQYQKKSLNSCISITGWLNFVNIITSDTNISLSYILEKDTYYEIIFAFNNKNITININNIPLGTYELCNQLLEDIIVRIKSTKSIFYHQYIKFIN